MLHAAEPAVPGPGDQESVQDYEQEEEEQEQEQATRPHHVSGRLAPWKLADHVSLFADSAQAKAVFILLPLIGVTSIFGFLVFNEETAYVFGVLSSVFNGLQVTICNRLCSVMGRYLRRNQKRVCMTTPMPTY